MAAKNTDDRHFDVVIIGLGPTGATLASLLGLSGVSTLVLEREPAAYHLPRAVHFDDEVMRVFQTIDVADDVSEIVRINPGMRFVDKQGKMLMDWPRPPEISPNGWHASYRFHQPDLEDILRNALARYDHVVTRSKADVYNLVDHGAHVQVQYEDMDNGDLKSVTARYVVGCDGARSIVRRFIGSGMENLGFEERWLVIDAILTRPKAELGDVTVQYCDPARPATYVRSPGDRRRWEITVLDDEDSDEIAEQSNVWKLLERWITPEDAILERTAVYTFRSAIAHTWHKGRLLLAGDAAHLTPPFMGQGMCAGVRDAANLAWKLARLLQGRAGDDILDSYQSERVPHVREFIATAVRLGGLINSSGTQDALNAAFRQPDGSVRMSSILPALGPGLGTDQSLGRGELFSQPDLAGGMKMDDYCGYGPLLIATDHMLDGNEDARAMLSSMDIPVLTTSGESDLAAALAQRGVGAALLRPDRYILGSANDPAALCTLLETQLIR